MVEDERPLREIMGEVLGEAGYASILAGTAKEALELVGVHPVDLSIVDLALPDMSGADLAATLRRKHPRVPVLMMSGHLRMDEEPKGTERAFLQKPFTIDALLGLVRRLLAP